MNTTQSPERAATRSHVEDEEERLRTLARYAILDTEAEAEFDRIVKQASALCKAPIALVSLVDRDRQWFKARVGLDVAETPRDVAFCAHAIQDDELLEVPDATLDARFADNPLVLGDPKIRFYAGTPLRSDNGHNLGTLCVIDRVPRRLSDAQREGLRELGREAMRQLDVRRRLHALAGQVRTAPAAAEPVQLDSGVYDTRCMALRFGRYTLLDELGSGAMAVVYAAYDSELDRKIALKLLHIRGDREDRAQALREGVALARVSHPNVVQVYEVGACGGQVFLSMEYVEGVTLAEWQVAPRRTIEELLRAYVQAGRGLVAMHRAGIVHRDFKARNVLIDRDGRARIVDFGLAQVSPRDPSNDVTTEESPPSRATEVVGTPAYMAPEQHRNAQVDERADQFSLCASLYEALYRVRPFAGDSARALREQVSRRALQPPPPGHGVPDTLRDVLLRGLSPEPADRWPTLDEMLDRLASYEVASDPAAVPSVQRLLIRVFLAIGAVCVAVLARPIAVDAEPTAIELTVVSAILVLFVAGAAGLTLHTAMQNRFHRRMLLILGTLFTTMLLVRGLGAAAGLPVATLLWSTHVALTMVCLAFIISGASFLVPLAGVQLCAACLDVFAAAPAHVIDMASGVASVLLFAHAWTTSTSRAARRASPPPASAALSATFSSPSVAE